MKGRISIVRTVVRRLQWALARQRATGMAFSLFSNKSLVTCIISVG
jgi:hypothetical protein